MTLTVTPVEFPPVLAPIPDTVTTANTPLNVVLNVTDPATSITNLTYSASVSDSTVIAGVNFSFNGTNEIATVYPVANATGDAAITIVVSDGVTYVYQSFAILVTRSQPAPILAPIADTNTTVNIPVNVVLNVTDPATAITNLIYSATIGSSNVISAVNFSYNGTNEIATIVPTTNKTGFTGITINVSDGVSNAFQSFAVTVTRLEFPPVLAAIANTNTLANTPVSVVLNVTDSATNITNLIYSAGITATNVIAAVNFSFNGTNEIATIVPATNKIGVSAITINVSDGVSNVYQSLAVTVTAPTPPTLGPIANQLTLVNRAVQVPLTVTSPVTPLASLMFSGSSSNPSLLTNITFAINGTNEVATLTPVTNALGLATVTLSVSDPFSTNSQSFTLQVNPLDIPPVIILPVTTTNTPANVPLTVAFAISNAQGNALAVSGTLSTNLGTVAITTNSAGTTNIPGNYTFTFTPNGVAGLGVTGLTTVIIIASDGTVSSTNTLALTVTTGLPPTLAIVSATNMPENSAISVPFTLSNVPTGFSRTNLAGIASNTNLVSFIGFSGASSNFTINLTLAPYATGSSTITIIVTDQFGSGTNSTTLTVTPVEYPPVLAPIADTATTANTPVSVVLNVTDPAMSITNLGYSAGVSDGTVIAGVNFSFNGTNEIATIYPALNATGDSAITIFVSDAVTSVSQSFAVLVTRSQAGPVLAPIADTNTTVNIPVKVTLNVTDSAVSITNLFYSAAIASTNVVSAVSFSFNGTNEIATIVPTTNKTGFTGISIMVSDGFTNVSQSFAVSVTKLEFPPVLAPIPDTNTTANTPLNVVLNVTDSATSITNLIYSAGISSTNVIAAVNFSFNGTNEIATIVPATNKIGVSAITITVSDGVSNVYQFLDVTVTAPTPPTLAPITNQFTSQNTAVLVPLIVTSPVTPLANLRFSGSSSNTNVVNSFTFSFNGSNEVATIIPVANATGVVTLTLSVSDPFSTNSQSFTLQVNPTALPTLTSTLGKDVVITFTGLAGGSYVIQSSTNLTTWVNVATVTADPVTGAVSYTATVPTNSPSQGYYRLLIP